MIQTRAPATKFYPRTFMEYLGEELSSRYSGNIFLGLSVGHWDDGTETRMYLGELGRKPRFQLFGMDVGSVRTISELVGLQYFNPSADKVADFPQELASPGGESPIKWRNGIRISTREEMGIGARQDLVELVGRALAKAKDKFELEANFGIKRIVVELFDPYTRGYNSTDKIVYAFPPKG